MAFTSNPQRRALRRSLVKLPVLFTAVHASDRTVTLDCWPEKPPIKTYRLSADGRSLDLVAATEEPGS